MPLTNQRNNRTVKQTKIPSVVLLSW